MRIPKRFIPGFPKCRIKRVEQILRDIHLRLFRGYYDVVIPSSMTGGKNIHIWNGDPGVSADDMVCAQPMTAPCNSQWEFTSSSEDAAGETREDLIAKIEEAWTLYFREMGSAGEIDRLKEIDDMRVRLGKITKGEGAS